MIYNASFATEPFCLFCDFRRCYKNVVYDCGSVTSHGEKRFVSVRFRNVNRCAPAQLIYRWRAPVVDESSMSQLNARPIDVRKPAAQLAYYCLLYAAERHDR